MADIREGMKRRSGSGGFAHVPLLPDLVERSLFRVVYDYFASLLGEGFLWSMKSILVVTAVLVYILTPVSLDFADIGWLEVLFLFLRNLLLFVLCAGGLHLYLHSFGFQGSRFRYFRQALGGGERFLFGSQVRDNMFWSLASGVPVWTANEALYYWFYGNGYLLRLEFMGSFWGMVWFIVLLVLVPHIQAIHFYIIHRFLHWSPIYSRFHALHHRNVNLGPWSGISMHPVEHVLYLFPWVVFFIFPSHPVHMLFFMHYLTLGAAFSHSGFERLHLGGNLSFPISGFYHQLHHRFYVCNYGNPDFPLDLLFGSDDDGRSYSKKT